MNIQSVFQLNVRYEDTIVKSERIMSKLITFSWVVLPIVTLHCVLSLNKIKRLVVFFRQNNMKYIILAITRTLE